MSTTVGLDSMTLIQKMYPAAVTIVYNVSMYQCLQG